MDVFKFKADARTAYQVKARSANDAGTIILHAVDSDGVLLGDGQSTNAGAITKMENLKLAKAGTIFVKVRSYDPNNSGDYSFASAPAISTRLPSRRHGKWSHAGRDVPVFATW
jgi:hypothetical protein